MGSRISQLPAGTTIGGTEAVPVVQVGATVQTTAAALSRSTMGLSSDLSAPSGSSLVGNIYDGNISAVAINLHEYIEDDGYYNVMGFVPQNLKSAIRNYTSTTAISTYVQSAISAGMAEGRGTRFPRGRYVSPGLTIIGYSGNGFVIDATGAVIRLGSNEGGIAISSASQNVTIRGLKFDSTAASGASQFGVQVTNSARIDLIKLQCNLLTTGVDWVSTLQSAGGIPMPSRIALCDIQACGNGFRARTTAEYVDLLLSRITDCTTTGALIQAGNCKQIGNTINANAIGLEIDGSVAGNADHGQASGNTINHNLTCGLYIHDLVYSMNATGNQVWATVGSAFGTGSYGSSFGVILKNAKNVNLSGSTLARNKVNLGVDVVTYSNLSGITFISDPSNTTDNIRQITALAVSDKNKIGGNTFESALSGGANNNDPEQVYVPALAGTWVNFGGGYSTAAYHKDAAGIVHIRGVVSTGTINTTVFTLPAGFRPATNYIWMAISNDLICRVEVSASGAVTPKNGSNVWVSLDGISFLAEA